MPALLALSLYCSTTSDSALCAPVGKPTGAARVREPRKTNSTTRATLATLRVNSVDDYGDDYGLRGEAEQSSTVIVAVVVNRNGEKTAQTVEETVQNVDEQRLQRIAALQVLLYGLAKISKESRIMSRNDSH